MDHKAFGGWINLHGIGNDASHKILDSPVVSESSGVVFPLANEQLKEKMEYSKKMGAQAQKDYAMAPTSNGLPQLHHRGFSKPLDKPSQAPQSMQYSEFNQPEVYPEDFIKGEVDHKFKPVTLLFWGAVFSACGMIGTGLAWAVKSAKEYISQSTERYQSFVSNYFSRTDH